MHTRAQRLVRAHERATLAYLARAPYDNVFLSWLIASDRSNATRSALFVCFDRGGGVCGVAFFGRQVVLAASDDEAIEAFASVAPGYRAERMIVGPKPVVDAFWARVAPWHAAARIERESQPVLAVDRRSLRGSRGEVIVRRARPSEWQSVAYNSAKMIEHELEYDPRSFSAEFNANVRMMIDRGLWWVGEKDGELCFFCNAGPHSPQTLQLQGIWTPPPLRGKGLASCALYGVCEELLGEVPSLSLYVNGFNEPALALYRRLGFIQVGEFKTLLF
ncbi:MAG TPA: GNAT family N-acetyltransferase [Candidatus Baltobacteraceae bacterium]|nr:GNAT family N-acetyltransferase [Candidatus Baltobacteraceae bacterium]